MPICLYREESPFWAASKSKERKLSNGMEGNIRNDRPDFDDSRGCDMARRAGLDVVRCEVKVERARFADDKLPTTK